MVPGHTVYKFQLLSTSKGSCQTEGSFYFHKTRLSTLFGETVGKQRTTCGRILWDHITLYLESFLLKMIASSQYLLF